LTATSLRIETRTGGQIMPLLRELAALRTRVFREWPYLYDGDENYESEYLKSYARSERAMLAVAYDGETVIGASTCMPMTDAGANVAGSVAAHGLDPQHFFYFGESVLLPAYRGHGLGVGFFAAREAHVLADGICDHALFYAVRREPNHPARPANATSLEGFWAHRGFTQAKGLSCTMRWKEISFPAEVENTLDAWVKTLKGTPLFPNAQP
jgi:GNAT superfamily N-acetyltransferase